MNTEEPNNEASTNDFDKPSPPNPSVILIFFGMIILFLLCLVYFFWPKDSEDIEPVHTTEVVSEPACPSGRETRNGQFFIAQT